MPASPHDAAVAERFRVLAEPHLDAAWNLARWLTRDADDAQDVVQDAYLRAFRFFDGYRGGDARAWLLSIVRNTAYTWLKQNRGGEARVEYDDADGSLQLQDEDDTPQHLADPQRLLLRVADAEQLDAALRRLAAPFREVLVLRELEELSYKQIASVIALPIGTVMSRLARARAQLRRVLEDMEST